MRRERRRLFRRMICRYATDVIAVSQAVLDDLPGVHPRHSVASVLYSAVTTRGLEDHLVDCDGPVRKVVQVGRLDPEKNQLFALDVFAELNRRRPEVEFWMVGRPTDGYRAQIERRIEELGIRDSVRLCGMRSDVMTTILPSSAAMLHTSTIEGLAGVILEAMATGTPVLASDIPPNREVASHFPGVTLIGLDEPASTWVDALLRLLDAPPNRAQRLEHLEAFRSSEFSLEQHIPGLLALWGASEPG